ncbi:type II toxin-antitoxin system HigB family toxin [Parashewanella spongiae]|uniref:Type II toxin-antitoxin system HigB family toxin n=1 Tax=Parashewanella spongiae TaxID=342950 RepID=A0A3A6TNI0_9GAMM|nr:type II toxin-antitoxin system HigB family toxin [Parashewanella spongiae]MCL1080201.1 type II toxin-antitoxin system HigB family toxin [Parashewanella spongiae]RJY01902.1 type II toxin-antitoxin system HigB family toxin [Parashewanella spongiae]
MHVVKKEAFETAKILHPKYAKAIDDTYKVLDKSKPKNPDELKKLFPSLDNFKYVDKWYVIDIGGKKLRLIAFITFLGDGHFYVRHICTHAEYDKIVDEYRTKSKKK